MYYANQEGRLDYNRQLGILDKPNTVKNKKSY